MLANVMLRCRLTSAGLGAALLVAACGGGGSSTSTPTPGEVASSGNSLHDSTAYSSAASASLASATEAAATSSHTIVLASGSIAYTASAGHLSARDPRSGAPEASMFYVAYTVAAAGPRPLVFFYNGGPGSATVWLHLGSFAPRRIDVAVPSVDVPQPYRLLDNADSLIDVADLVFVDMVGSGYSEAIAPYSNRSFWGVDADAALMRDFIARYVAVNRRETSPTFIFGESYGTTRSAVLAELMLAAGMRLDGVVLQSSILDYNSNCGVFDPGQLSCEGHLPSYGEVGAWFGLTRPVPSSADAFATQLRSFAQASYRPAIAAYLTARQPPAAALTDQLSALTGIAAPLWASNFDLGPDVLRSALLPGQLLGGYDARVHAATNSAAAAAGDPSSSLITGPFAAAAAHLFKDELLYSADASYTLLSDAIDSWIFNHDNRALPDVVPDLAAALARQPTLRVLSLAGYHDLVTPFWQTERDLLRLGSAPTVASRVYAGGHMTYLDDGSRPRERAVVAAFLAGGTLPAQPTAAVPGAHTESSSGAAASSPAVPIRIAAAPVTMRRAELAQGGDPYLPPRMRLPATAASPAGADLQSLVARKIAAHDREAQR